MLPKKGFAALLDDSMIKAVSVLVFVLSLVVFLFFFLMLKDKKLTDI